MSKKKNSFLPKFEVLIILVFFFSFMAWAASKCSETKALYQDELVEEDMDTNTTEAAGVVDSTAMALSNVPNTNNNSTTTTAPTGVQTPAPTNSNPTTNQGKLAPLYITIDGLNMRSGPTRDSAIVLKLKLFEQVNFLGEFTDSTEQINLGYEIADEPWFKVQHKRGKVGWVYGAGVNFYKKKRSGVVQ